MAEQQNHLGTSGAIISPISLENRRNKAIRALHTPEISPQNAVTSAIVRVVEMSKCL